MRRSLGGCGKAFCVGRGSGRLECLPVRRVSEFPLRRLFYRCARKVGHLARSPAKWPTAISHGRASCGAQVPIGETLSSFVGEADRGCVGELPPNPVSLACPLLALVASRRHEGDVGRLSRGERHTRRREQTRDWIHGEFVNRIRDIVVHEQPTATRSNSEVPR